MSELRGVKNCVFKVSGYFSKIGAGIYISICQLVKVEDGFELSASC